MAADRVYLSRCRRVAKKRAKGKKMVGHESSLAAADVTPIARLQFKLSSVSPYVTSRTELYYVHAGNTFGPAGVRTQRVSCSGSGFPDLPTAILEFTVTNNSGASGL